MMDVNSLGFIKARRAGSVAGLTLLIERITFGWIPDGKWVRVRGSGKGGLRYITRQTSAETFLDDGKYSLQPYCQHCFYKYYEQITNYSIVKYQPHESNSTTG
jgi:hypothetical protein